MSASVHQVRHPIHKVEQQAAFQTSQHFVSPRALTLSPRALGTVTCIVLLSCIVLLFV
jgi:hypothetical protein